MKSQRRVWTIGLAILVIGFAGGLIYFTRQLSRIRPNPEVTIGSPSAARRAATANSNAVASQLPVAAPIQNQLAIQWDVPDPEPPFARFAEWVRKYSQAATSAERSALEREGIELAKERRAALKALIESDPERALKLSVPLRVRRAMPPAIAALLEDPVSGRGELAVLAALPEPGKENLVTPVFRTATFADKEYRAFVYGRRLGEPTRRELPLNGIAVDNFFAVNENPVRPLEPEEAEEVKPLAAEAICGISGQRATINNQPTPVDVGGQIVFLCGPNHVALLNDRLVAAESGGPTGGASPQDVQASAWTEGLKNVILIRVDFPDLTGISLTDSGGASLVSSLQSF